MVTANHRFEAVDIPIMHQGIRAVGISISDDVWIGAGCILLDGVIVGSGSVIAAGAVVSKSIPPMAVAAGVPARVLRYRDSRE
jgi:acetyltransferase-like isoleucine patch superfamily enzyme